MAWLLPSTMRSRKKAQRFLLAMLDNGSGLRFAHEAAVAVGMSKARASTPCNARAHGRRSASPLPEIAEVLDIPVSTVRSRLRYGLRRFTIAVQRWRRRRD